MQPSKRTGGQTLDGSVVAMTISFVRMSTRRKWSVAGRYANQKHFHWIDTKQSTGVAKITECFICRCNKNLAGAKLSILNPSLIIIQKVYSVKQR